MPTTSTTRIIPGALWDNSGMVKNARHPSFGGGAKADGVTDDTAALQACLTASLTKGDVCVIPPGDYKTTAPLIPPGSNAFIDSSKHRVIMHGARFFSYDATASRPVFKLNTFIGQEGTLTLEGGTIDGTNAVSTLNGVEIHCNNVTLDGTVIRYCNKGVTYVNDLAGPPICSRLDGCQIQLNTIGVYATVPTSNLVIVNSRIEGNDEEGIYLDNCGKVCIIGNTIENNGFVTATKNNLYVRNSVDGLIAGNYFESTSGQTHTSVAFEGVSTAVFALVFTGNRIVNGGSLGAAGSIGVDIGVGTGAIEGVIAHGNYYSSQTTAVRLGTNARGCTVGPDYFSDNFNPAGSAHTRYNIISTQANVVSDINRYAAAIYPGSSIYQALKATQLTVSGGAHLAGTIFKSATLGMTVQGIAGSGFDYTLVTPGSAAIMQVPTGTVDQLAAGHLKVNVVGKGLFVKEGTNAKAGSAVLVAGSVVVSTTAVTANSRIQVTSNVDGGTPGWLRVSARTAGTSFTITSSSGTDTSTVSWLIVEPA